MDEESRITFTGIVVNGLVATVLWGLFLAFCAYLWFGRTH
jgi:hypothetical protein